MAVHAQAHQEQSHHSPAESSHAEPRRDGVTERAANSPDPYAAILALQRSAGNRAVLDLLSWGTVSTQGANDIPMIVQSALNRGGQSLDTRTRALMEARFEHDFGDVRVHVDAQAAKAAEAMNARAFTFGHDVVFKAGQYAPGTREGQRLLAHELTHTIQQGVAARQLVAKRGMTAPSDAIEREAETAAAAVMQERPYSPSLRGYVQIARQPAGSAAPTATSTRRGITSTSSTTVAARVQNRPDQAIHPGDVVVRAGTFSGKNPLVKIIGEQYNHGGVALDSNTVHHVEANGYETVTIKTFFDPENASGGAVLRFQGPFANQIRARVVQIARAQRYVKIPGNPFSTADDLRTVNCNEFVHELFRQAIAELTAEAQRRNPATFQQFLAAYGDPAHSNQARKLIEPKRVEFQTGGFSTGPAVSIAEALGRYGVTKEAKARGAVRVAFEGKLERRNLYPAEWAYSWNPFKLRLYQKGFYIAAVLRTYTPDSFVNSRFFALVRRVKAGAP